MKNIRDWLAGTALLFAYWFAGVSLATFVPLPLPAAFWGLLLALVHCAGAKRVPNGLRLWAGLMTRFLPMLFVPVLVRLWQQTDIIYAGGVPLMLVIVISTFITLLVPALVVQWIMKK